MPTELLFSYGTLQLDQVQLATFHRRLKGRPDVLRGFAEGPLKIEDESVVALSGRAVHPMATFTGRSFDVIPGTVFEVTPTDLEATDKYEVSAVKRVAVMLDSGTRAWAYVDARNAPPDA